MIEALDYAEGKNWSLYCGDSVEILRQLPDQSVGYSIFSPPFASLYTYSNSDRDLGNCRNDAEFFDHYRFILEGLMQVMKPGRLVSMHCMDMPTSKTRDGVIGAKDFPGHLIAAAERVGFIFHSRVCIWKDPVTAMQRTKALGLLYKQVKKDSCMSRQGFADYVVTVRVPGENPEPCTKAPHEFPVSLWQRYASPVWMDIDASDTLQFKAARESEDERHICPLQLEVIRRCVRLWSNPGDVVLSPFAGIGSEVYCAAELGRKGVGIELKPAYFKQATKNLEGLATAPADLFESAA